jgi:hypothetical protein
VSIFVYGCSKPPEKVRHIVFTGYDSGSQQIKLELTSYENKIEFTLKCLGGTMKDDKEEQKTDNCYYSVGDSMDENSMSESNNDKTNFHFRINNELITIVEVTKLGTPKPYLELKSSYKVISSKVLN